MNKKPVFEVSVNNMWDYEFQAKNSYNNIILASNSLNNLKKEIKIRNWDLAWITTSNGCLSYGQNLVNEYPYKPRY